MNVLVCGSASTIGFNVVQQLQPQTVIASDACHVEMNPCRMLGVTCYKSPLADKITYKGFIKKLIQAHNISIVIASNNYEVRKLHDLQLPGVYVNGTSPNSLNFLDKRETSFMFLRAGIKTPRHNGLKIPFILRKNLTGIDKNYAYFVRDAEALRKISISEIRDGFCTNIILGKEFSIDVLCDDDSNMLVAVPRLRHDIKNGMVNFAEVVNNELLLEKTRILCKKLMLTGINCVHCIQSVFNSEKFYYFEVNTKPGSGIDLSHAAGINFPKMLIDMKKGAIKIPEIDWGLKMLRYSKGFYFK